MVGAVLSTTQMLDLKILVHDMHFMWDFLGKKNPRDLLVNGYEFFIIVLSMEDIIQQTIVSERNLGIESYSTVECILSLQIYA